MERKVLGRGLEALIPTTSSADGTKERVITIGVTQIRASRFQPRLNFSADKIEELANSIKEKGIIQPVLVRVVDGDKYELIAGERRFRAAQKAGLTEIPAIVRRVPDADVLEMSIIENIQREDLNAVDEAKAYRRLAQEFGHSQDQIAQKVGKDKSSISNLLRILNLPEKVQDLLVQNLISFGHARALLSLGDANKQEAISLKIVKKGLSVRQIELLGQRRAKVRKDGPVVDRDVQALQDKLRDHLGTKVTIKHGKKRGVVEIEYYSLEDLDRLLAKIGVR